jgi:hypothetical protein
VSMRAGWSLEESVARVSTSRGSPQSILVMDNGQLRLISTIPPFCRAHHQQHRCSDNKLAQGLSPHLAILDALIDTQAGGAC